MTPVAHTPRAGIRVTYFKIARNSFSGKKVALYMVFASKSWTAQNETAAWEPFGSAFSPARGDGVRNDHMDKLVQGLVQAGLKEFPPIDLSTIDMDRVASKEFRGTVVTVQTPGASEAFLIRDRRTGRSRGSPQAVLVIDQIMSAFGDFYAMQIQTNSGPAPRRR